MRYEPKKYRVFRTLLFTAMALAIWLDWWNPSDFLVGLLALMVAACELEAVFLERVMFWRERRDSLLDIR